MKLPKINTDKGVFKDALLNTKVFNNFEAYHVSSNMHSRREFKQNRSMSLIDSEPFYKLLAVFSDPVEEEKRAKMDQLLGEDRYKIDSLVLLGNQTSTTTSDVSVLLSNVTYAVEQDFQWVIASLNLFPNHIQATRMMNRYDELSEKGFVEIPMKLENISNAFPNIPFVKPGRYGGLMDTAKEDYKYILRMFVNKETNQHVILTNRHSVDIYIPYLMMYLGTIQLNSEKQLDIITDLMQIYKNEDINRSYKDPRVLTYMKRSNIETINEVIEVLKDTEEIKEVPLNEKIEQITPLFSGIEDQTIETLKQNIVNLQNRIEYHLNEIRKEQRNLKDAQKELIYNKAMPKDHTELIEYLLKNNDILEFEVVDSKLKLLIYTQLNDYEPELFELYYKNPSLLRGYSHEASESKKTFELLKHIFVDGEATLKVAQQVILDLNRANLEFESAYNTSDLSQKASNYLKYKNIGLIPNFHLDNYSCSGENEAFIREALKKGDFIQACAIAIGTVQGFNFADDIVTSDLFQQIYADLSVAGTSQRARYIYSFQTGEHYTPQEYFKEFIEESKEE